MENMAGRDHWIATKKLITGFTHPRQHRDTVSPYAHLHALIPFKRCSVWAWRALREPLIFNGDLYYRVVIPEGTAGFRVRSTPDPVTGDPATERLLADYEDFLEEKVDKQSGMAEFKGVMRRRLIQGLCYKPEGNGVFSALVIHLERDCPVAEPERVLLFECSLPMVSVLFEQRFLRENQEKVIHRIPSLSPRQRTILKLLAEGKDTQRMALSLCLSERTVSWHLQNIYRKLGVGSRKEALAYIRKRSLVASG
ncbi:MAG: helix-turn-helix transcriptional regulator [Oleiphilaceae bacterium]|nr:helix-turn-helix transcriptional regulator [Oleiphilaceae bacterium]